jgi:hypothetical protein
MRVPGDGKLLWRDAFFVDASPCPANFHQHDENSTSWLHLERPEASRKIPRPFLTIERSSENYCLLVFQGRVGVINAPGSPTAKTLEKYESLATASCFGAMLSLWMRALVRQTFVNMMKIRSRGAILSGQKPRGKSPRGHF